MHVISKSAVQNRLTCSATESAQKLLSAVYRTGERFGAGYLIEHLRGEASERAERYGHTRLSTFGVGADLPVKQWRSLIRQLIARGTLENTSDAYGALRFTGDAQAVLRGKQKLYLRLDRTSPGKRDRRRSSTATVAPADQPLWEALRTERKRLADEQGVPAFMIFSDATLRDMLARRPRSADEMLAVHGVGEKKFASYGTAFLRIIAAT